MVIDGLMARESKEAGQLSTSGENIREKDFYYSYEL
jgi:hypothetical protein